MSQDKEPKKVSVPVNRYANPHGRTAWARAGASSAFKALNPELFIKPNMFTTVIGLITLTGCVSFMAYMHAMDENAADLREGNAYKAVDEEGNYAKAVTRKSRWD